MEPAQLDRVAAALEKIATKASATYTLTGAADWEILAVMGGALFVVIGLMWTDLRTNIKDNKAEWQRAIKEHKEETEKQNQILWDAMRHCQGECCPPRRNHSEG